MENQALRFYTWEEQMTLQSDLNGILSEDPEIDPDSIARAVGAVLVQDDVYDTAGRWYDTWRAIFSRSVNDDRGIRIHTEYVEGYYCVGSTEMQEDTEKDWTFGPVVPKQVTRIIYEPIDKNLVDVVE